MVYCSDCMLELGDCSMYPSVFEQCHRCGNYELAEDIRQVNDTELLCECCAEWATPCRRCELLYEDDHLTYVEDIGDICDWCKQDLEDLKNGRHI